MRHRVVWNRWTLAGLAVVTLLGLAALAAPWLAPGDATRGDLAAALRSPSTAYLLGTDAQGRDVLSRVLFGARLSLAVGLASQVIALAAGLALGLSAGFYGRWVDAVLGRHDRRGAGSAAGCAVGVALPGARDRRHGAGRQPRGRRLARRARRAGMTDIAYHPTRLRALRDQFRALRAAEFPWTADTVYLNNASIGPIPERTRRALDEFTAKRTAPHLLPDRELQAGLQAARVAVARLLNAEPAEIALATNTSHGLNLAACALPLQRGDVVLVSDREFPANV